MNQTSPLESLAGPGKSLRRQRYRSSNRYIVFQALQHTLGLGPEVWSRG